MFLACQVFFGHFRLSQLSAPPFSFKVSGAENFKVSGVQRRIRNEVFSFRGIHVGRRIYLLHSDVCRCHRLRVLRRARDQGPLPRRDLEGAQIKVSPLAKSQDLILFCHTALTMTTMVHKSCSPVLSRLPNVLPNFWAAESEEGSRFSDGVALYTVLKWFVIIICLFWWWLNDSS